MHEYRTPTVVTPPAEEPVTKTEVKAQSGLLGTADDTKLDSLIAAARAKIEKEYLVRCVTQTLKLTLDGFPTCGDRTIRLPVGPVASVSSITYLDENGDSQTLSTDDYVVDKESHFCRIQEAETSCWPTTACRMNAVSITFVAGYGDEEDVEPDVKHAILLLVGHYFENPEATTDKNLKDLPLGVESMMSGNSWRGYY